MRTALVIGTGQVGRATAAHLLAGGWDVRLVGRDPARSDRGIDGDASGRRRGPHHPSRVRPDQARRRAGAPRLRCAGHGPPTVEDPRAGGATLSALIGVVADRPGVRILNDADADAPDVAAIATAIGDRLGGPFEQVLVEGAAPCRSPWDAVPPRLLDTTAAQALGWRPSTYATSLELDWLVRFGPGAERLPERLFDYAAEDRALSGGR